MAETKLGSKEYNEIYTKIFDFHAENLLIIGAVGMVPDPYIAKKNIGNIPKGHIPAGGSKDELGARAADQLSFKQ